VQSGPQTWLAVLGGVRFPESDTTENGNSYTFQVVAGSQTCHSFRLSGLRTRQHIKTYPFVLLDQKMEIPIRSSYKITVKKQIGSYKLPKTPSMEAASSECVYDPELFGLPKHLTVDLLRKIKPLRRIK